MLQIIYLSNATRTYSLAEVLEMLAKFRPSNEALGVTGLLVYSGSTFLQVLEGPEVSVRATYEAIIDDDRHENVTLLVERQVSERKFGDWSMGFPTDAKISPEVLPGFSNVFQGEPVAESPEELQKAEVVLSGLAKVLGSDTSVTS